MHVVIGFYPFTQAYLVEDVATTLDLNGDMFEKLKESPQMLHSRELRQERLGMQGLRVDVCSFEVFRSGYRLAGVELRVGGYSSVGAGYGRLISNRAF